MNKVDLGRKIQHYRHLRKLTQEQLAELADISTVFLSEIECGKSQPSIEVFLRISAQLNIRPQLLLDKNVPPKTTDFLKRLTGVNLNSLTDSKVHDLSVFINMYINFMEKRQDTFNIGQQIKIHRETVGLNRKQLGHAIGKSGAFVGRIESSKTGLSLDTLADISAALQIDVEHLLLYPRISEEFIIENLLDQNFDKLTVADKETLAASIIKIINDGEH